MPPTCWNARADPIQSVPSFSAPSALPRTNVVPAGPDSYFQLSSGSDVLRARQHEQPLAGLAGRLGQAGRRVAHLLQVPAELVDLDVLEVEEAMLGPTDLDPAAVHPGLDAVQLAERVVAVLGFPQGAGVRIERHAEPVAVAVREHLLDVRTDLAAHGGAGGEERIVGRRAAIVVQPQDDAGEMGVVRRRTTEGVVHERGGFEGAVGQVLQPAAASLVAHEDVQLAVRTEADHAAVVVAVRAGVGGAGMAAGDEVVGLQRPQRDHGCRSNVSVVPFQT